MTARDVIAQALALSEAATEGPWEYDPDSDVGAVWAGPTGDQQQVACALTDLDGEFIAAARTLLPVLAKALGDVLAVLDDYEGAFYRRTNGSEFEVLAVTRENVEGAITAALSEVASV